jgi:hypothetical protein
MSKRPRTRQHKARFPRLRELREEVLGWEVAELIKRLPNHRPSASSIYRLEQDDAIRVTNARRIFDAINAALDNTLDPKKELKVTEK